MEASDSHLTTLIEAALREDLGRGDVTTNPIVSASSVSEAVIVAKTPMVVAGSEVVSEVFTTVDGGLMLEVLHGDGTTVGSDTVLTRLRGSTRSILAGERTALNFLGRLSGIATLTGSFVEAVAGTGARVIDTRKTTPGWRELEKAAVRSGGAENHRMGLFDMILIKENHIAAAGGIEAAVNAVRREHAELPLEVEVRTLEELELVLALSVHRVLLDNMSLALLRESVRMANARPDGRPMLEASGNVTLATVRAVAETGVDLISVGALTHSAPSADISLQVIGEGS